MKNVFYIFYLDIKMLLKIYLKKIKKFINI